MQMKIADLKRGSCTKLGESFHLFLASIPSGNADKSGTEFIGSKPR
ncbi:hypothetical protein [Vibrio splendidus]|nr:hypothetical protein [Vibrio splendidus]MDH5932777.1 hypothetical protein [Vibrio splendidus]